MFGIGSQKKKFEPKVKWDEWNERFESDNGDTFSADGISSISFYCDDFGNDVTVRQFLRSLLCAVWDEEDSFSAKRPFGSSNWKHEMMKAFIERGIIQGLLNSEGDIQTADEGTFNHVVSTLIKKAL